MQHYKLMKKIIDIDDGTLDGKDLAQLLNKNQAEINKSLLWLEKNQYIYEENGKYYPTEHGRIYFANEFSRRTMIILITITLLIAAAALLLSKLN